MFWVARRGVVTGPLSLTELDLLASKGKRFFLVRCCHDEAWVQLRLRYVRKYEATFDYSPLREDQLVIAADVLSAI